MRHVNIIVEGRLDGAVANRLISTAGLIPVKPIEKGGRNKIIAKLPDYYSASRSMPWFILMDLDRNCAGTLLHEAGVPNVDEQFVCRFAVREIESWLLADRENLSEFLSLSIERLPRQPDALEDAKRSLISIARFSRRQQIRKDFLPREGSVGETGPGYNMMLNDFIESRWNIANASIASPSLKKALEATRSLARRLIT